MNSAPAPFPPPQAAAKFRASAPADRQATAPREEVQSLAEAKSHTTENRSRKSASRLDAAAQPDAAPQRGAAAQPDAAPQPGAAAQPGAAPQPGLIGGNTTASAQSAWPLTDPSAALRRAAETGDVQRLRTILDASVRVDAPDSRGRTALMLAASRGQAESVDVLLAHGADPNAVDTDGTTPLKAALAADQPAIVAALRRAGAR